MVGRPIILSITGSDGTGGAGVQADIQTISALGGMAVTAITSVTVQSHGGIHHVHHLPADVVAAQVQTIVEDAHPAAIKLGLMGDAEAIAAMRDHIVGCPRIVCDPGILSSHGTRLMDDEALASLRRHLLPEATLLMLRCSETELLLNTRITTDDDMLRVARRLTEIGPQWVMLRGAQHAEGRLTALLYGTPEAPDDVKAEPLQQFFSSYNIEGWQRHGVGGALSSAIATRLAFGDDVPTAIRHAHDYLHSQVVYAVEPYPSALPLESLRANCAQDKRCPGGQVLGIRQRPAELYNRLLNLIAAHFRTAHDVAFYADRLAITPRYLSQVTRAVVEKSPKQVIDEYLLHETETLLRTTSLTIQEISWQLGFSSPVQLSKFVQKQRGCSPSQIRRT